MGKMPRFKLLLIHSGYKDYWTEMFCCLSDHDKCDRKAWISIPTITSSIIIHINSTHVCSCCSCCLVVCGGEAFGCHRLTRSLIVSVYFSSLAYMAAGGAAASPLVLSSAERRAREIWVWFLYVFAWFSTEIQMKWLMAAKAPCRAGACFAAHRLLSLINLFTQTENGCRRM